VAATPHFLNIVMLKVDESDFTTDHREYLQEWADMLGIAVEVLLGRIVMATCEGDLYSEDAPEDRPDGE
jgi:hypothetical protein